MTASPSISPRFPLGAHLRVARGLYVHHGLDLGDGRILQYGGGVFSDGPAVVEIVSREAFAAGGTIEVEDSPIIYVPDLCVRRGLRRLGETRYNAAANNCEHFVNWCRSGRHESRQVNRVVHRTASAASKVAARGSAVLAGRALARAPLRAATPFLILADLAQFSAELTARRLGADVPTADRTGRRVGLVVSAAIGGLAGGPVGAAAGGTAWAAGEVLGARVVEASRRHRDRRSG